MSCMNHEHDSCSCTSSSFPKDILGGFSGSCLGSVFSTAVLVIHCEWISSFHHLISGQFPILYIMLAYSLKSLCNLHVQWQKYCFIVCMRGLFVWISHLINWWFYVWLFMRCVFSGNSGISCDVYSLKSLYELYNDKVLPSYICSFLLSVTVPMLFFLLFLLFPCERGWVSTLACMSSSFPSPMLDGSLRLMLGFRIFQRLCSWSFMYEFHHLINGWVPIWYIHAMLIL